MRTPLQLAQMLGQNLAEIETPEGIWDISIANRNTAAQSHSGHAPSVESTQATSSLRVRLPGVREEADALPAAATSLSAPMPSLYAPMPSLYAQCGCASSSSTALASLASSSGSSSPSWPSPVRCRDEPVQLPCMVNAVVQSRASKACATTVRPEAERRAVAVVTEVGLHACTLSTYACSRMLNLGDACWQLANIVNAREATLEGPMGAWRMSLATPEQVPELGSNSSFAPCEGVRDSYAGLSHTKGVRVRLHDFNAVVRPPLGTVLDPVGDLDMMTTQSTKVGLRLSSPHQIRSDR